MPPELWLMNADGSGQRPVFAQEGSASWHFLTDHAWSPDGTEIAFIGSGTLQIHSLTTDTTRVVYSHDGVQYVEWSPTGEWIAVATAWGDPRGLFLVRPDGTDWHHIGPDAQAVAPSWSPAGSRIAATYFYGPEEPVHLALVTVQGDVRVLASDLEYTTSSWSPDGTQLAYSDKDARLTVVDADGAVTKITPPATSYGDIAWSPDGSKIAYAGSDGIYAVNPDGSGKIKLFDHGLTPEWDPSGSALAATVSDDIFRVSKDGAGVTNLTNTPEHVEQRPAWSPDGTKIAYLRNDKPHVPPDETVERSIWLAQRRHVVLKGRVQDPSGWCGWGATKVIFQRKRPWGWDRIGNATGDQEGRFRLRVGDRPGRYRAVVHEEVLDGPWGNQITCTAARSNVVIHRH